MLSMKSPTCVGIIGGGQLGKMIAHEARRMSFRVIVLDPTEGCPASRIADEQIVADFKDEAAIMRLAEKCDVLTYEIELANSTALKQLEEKNYPVRPAPETLRIIQNKHRQKSFLQKHRIAVPDFELVKSEEHLHELCQKFGLPAVLKATEDSYDGRGNFVIKTKGDIHRAYEYFKGREIMLEKFVLFTKEVSIMVARNPSGQIESFPVVENIHKNSILDTTIAPAQISRKVEQKAIKLAKRTMEVLHGAGIFGIEMFVTKRGDVLINEIAPRVHNSGHYTNEACSVSQFEQHLRAVLDLPLAKPELLSPAVMINILGPEDFDGVYAVAGLDAMMKVPGAELYVYGKKVSKPRRKLGHITATGRTVKEALARAKKARNAITLVPAAEKEGAS
ncbi:5-(carboxyamino)imidazole ribonucleotide synthase [Candidatus Nitrososphaera evergladensis SR1]|jgi:5-(carboxyamino)imidazole ribonucleotide synthase|uniref:N5-carboxyaminoimidazole ribonucleotide synthase n=2 Tax=Nitrososphaera TaxID=497726 RepID=A0A075MX77_9ARCH|nr:5-(carboxyamino)imidazole ribonucleotide synthase [Candidatus Nitrososphaera evergladensis SR1]